MIQISSCKFNGIDVHTIHIQQDGVSAEIGFLMDSTPFGAADVSGLDEDDAVRDAAAALKRAVEAAVAKLIGNQVDAASTPPPGLFDQNI